MSEITLTSDNFEEEVLNSDVPVLVDFWAPWCGHCRVMAPVVTKVAGESNGMYKVGKVNVDEQEDIASRYMIMSIPTFKVFVNGNNTRTVLGVRNSKELKNMIEKENER